MWRDFFCSGDLGSRGHLEADLRGFFRDLTDSVTTEQNLYRKTNIRYNHFNSIATESERTE